MDRKAGAVLPLFSLRTRRDWGIGQITDLPACAAWLRGAGQRLLQILPPHELSAGETSPYGALTAFGLDPIYADVEAIPDLDAGAIAEALGEGQKTLAEVRALPAVQYAAVRELKARALHAAFERFEAREWTRETPRGKRLAAFVASEKAWLDDLALYDVLRGSHGGWGWPTWPEGEKERAPLAIDDLRARAGRRLREVAYVQWVLHEQWHEARARLREQGVELMGDLPFVVGAESADVWSHASQFQLALSLGAPPDAYSADGQEWGLPPYNWLAMEADDLAWVRARTRHAAALYDRFRLDHVVGYFRQWVKNPSTGSRGRFDPEGTDAQGARGRRVLGAILEELAGEPGVAPPRALAEDLGVIPPFVRDVLRELGMPGYKVLPWEKDDDGRFRDPRAFPEGSIVSWSTHDTAPIVSWWDELSEHDRRQLAARAGVDVHADERTRTLALLRDLYGSGSGLALTLVQELLGLRDRINTPATVGAHNWTFRLPRPIEDLAADGAVAARLAEVRGLVEGAGR